MFDRRVEWGCRAAGFIALIAQGVSLSAAAAPALAADEPSLPGAATGHMQLSPRREAQFEAALIDLHRLQDPEGISSSARSRAESLLNQIGFVLPTLARPHVAVASDNGISLNWRKGTSLLRIHIPFDRGDEIYAYTVEQGVSAVITPLDVNRAVGLIRSF